MAANLSPELLSVLKKYFDNGQGGMNNVPGDPFVDSSGNEWGTRVDHWEGGTDGDPVRANITGYIRPEIAGHRSPGDWMLDYDPSGNLNGRYQVEKSSWFNDYAPFLMVAAPFAAAIAGAGAGVAGAAGGLEGAGMEGLATYEGLAAGDAAAMDAAGWTAGDVAALNSATDAVLTDVAQGATGVGSLTPEAISSAVSGGKITATAGKLLTSLATSLGTGGALSLIKNLSGVAHGRNESDATKTASQDAATFLQDRTRKTADYADQLGAGASQLLARALARGALPSTTGDTSSAYYQTAKGSGPDLDMLKGWATGDRLSLADQLQRAIDASGRRVDVKEYSTDGVADRSAQKYSRLVGGVDRAAAIAASQGFADSLRGGMGLSTAAAAKGNDLTRQFSDVYSKLAEQADSSALAENDNIYKNYLGGKQSEIDQNYRLAGANNSLYQALAGLSSNSSKNYADSATMQADHLLKALGLADDATLKTWGADDATLRAALAGAGTFNNNALEAAGKQQAAASLAYKEASKTQSDDWARLIDSSAGKAATGALDKFLSGLFD